MIYIKFCLKAKNTISILSLTSNIVTAQSWLVNGASIITVLDNESSYIDYVKKLGFNIQ